MDQTENLSESNIVTEAILTLIRQQMLILEQEVGKTKIEMEITTQMVSIAHHQPHKEQTTKWELH